MSKSTISFATTTKGYVVRQGSKIVFRSTVRKDARQVLRTARAAERGAIAFLKGVEVAAA